jgi:hypothetical protein
MHFTKKGSSVAEPQPKHGAFLAKTQSAQSSEIKDESHLSKTLFFTYNLGAFAPWREEIPIPSAFKFQSLARAAQIPKHSSTKV